MSKKLVIDRESLPDINAFTGKYEVRFRLTTEDRNRFSYWSPIFSTDPDFVYITGNTDISKQSNHAKIVWDVVTIEKDSAYIGQVLEYDIWIRWSRNGPDGDWIYVERVEGTSVEQIIPSSYFYNGVEIFQIPNRITVEIYAKGRPITRDSSLLRLYNPPIQTI